VADDSAFGVVGFDLARIWVRSNDFASVRVSYIAALPPLRNMVADARLLAVTLKLGVVQEADRTGGKTTPG
jgi:hypothetical protein